MKYPNQQPSRAGAGMTEYIIIVILIAIALIVVVTNFGWELQEKGAEATIDLTPDQAFGYRRDELVEKVDRSKLSKDMQFEVGTQFEVPGPSSHPEAVRVVGLTDEEVTFDRNHPLAGKGMKFSVTIREVRDATPLEIEHGHPMTEDGGCGCDH